MILDVDARVLIDGEKVTKLTKREVTFLEAISDANTVSYCKLIGIFWPDNEPDYAKKMLEILACKLRRALPIGNVWATGYRLGEPLEIRRSGPGPILIPNEHRAILERLLYSHPDRAAADRVLASMVG